MTKKLILLAAMILISGCAKHGPSITEINSLCLIESESGSCMGQEEICNGYKLALQKTYSSATECRKACESVQNKFSANIDAQGCDSLFDNISGLCNEYCDGNYRQ